MIKVVLNSFIMDFISNIDFGKALLTVPLIILVLSATIYVIILQTKYCSEKTINFSNDKVIVFIIAHPDDECMFFGPTILQAVNGNPKEVHLLCLTTGNAYKMGRIRQKELFESCKGLSLPACNVQIFDDRSFPDGSQEWNYNVLVPKLFEFVKKVKPDYIFTFDDYGVSGHSNHIATSHAVRRLYKELQPNDKIPVLYELESVSIYRKYLSFMDIPQSVIASRLCFISSPSNILKIQILTYVIHPVNLLLYQIRGEYSFKFCKNKWTFK